MQRGKVTLLKVHSALLTDHGDDTTHSPDTQTETHTAGIPRQGRWTDEDAGPCQRNTFLQLTRNFNTINQMFSLI